MDPHADRLHEDLVQAELADGLVTFAVLGATSTLTLCLGVALLGLPLGPLVSLALFPLLLGIGISLRRGRNSSVERVRRRLGVDADLARAVIDLEPMHADTRRVVDDALAVSASVHELAEHPVWRRLGVPLEPPLDAVADGVRAVLAEAAALEELRRVAESCRAAARRPERFSSLDVRVDARLAALRRRADSLEELLAALTEVLAASLDSRCRRAEVEARLVEFTSRVTEWRRSFEAETGVERMTGDPAPQTAALAAGRE